MQRVRGIGGIFLKCQGDRATLLDWYRDVLGIPADPAWGGTAFVGEDAARDGTIWSLFAADSDYLGDGARCMVNYKVDDLDAMLAQLRAAGARVADEVQDGDFGRFGWAWDPEGNKFELWQPPG